MCLSGYMGWISKRQRRGNNTGADKEKSSRNVKSRSKQVSPAIILSCCDDSHCSARSGSGRWA